MVPGHGLRSVWFVGGRQWRAHGRAKRSHSGLMVPCTSQNVQPRLKHRSWRGLWQGRKEGRKNNGEISTGQQSARDHRIPVLCPPQLPSSAAPQPSAGPAPCFRFLTTLRAVMLELPALRLPLRIGTECGHRAREPPVPCTEQPREPVSVKAGKNSARNGD